MQAPLKADKGLNPPWPPAPCILGIDVGTTSVKSVLMEEMDEGPSVIACCTRATQAEVKSVEAPMHGNEQDVCKIIAALNNCLAALPPESLERVSRIGISGQMHGVMFWKTGKGCRWSESGGGWTFEPNEVSRLVTWQDGRCSQEFLASLPLPQTHLSVASGFGCSTIFWYLKNSPDFMKPYNAAGTVQDYVVAMLCGQEKPQMSEQNAASWGYFKTTDKCWNSNLLRESGFPIHLLPEVVQSGDLAGETAFAWHRIPKGTKVGVALGDFQCSVYSCMTENSDAVLNIGTSAQLTIYMPPEFQPAESPDPHLPVAYFPYFGSRYLAVAASLNGGNVMATFVNMLVGWMAELGLEVSESDLYQPMFRAALAEPETHLDICPTIFGERHLPGRLASATGIAASELSLGRVVRALCRGVVQNLQAMLSSQSLKEAGVKRILASGSGLCRNEVMRQEVEKAYALPVVCGKEADAAVGAALLMLRRGCGLAVHGAME